MPSFSTIFPTYAGLFSKIGNFIVPSKPKIGAAVQPGQVSKPGETTGETMSRNPAKRVPHVSNRQRRHHEGR